MNNIYGFDIEAVPLGIFHPNSQLLCASISQDFTISYVRDHYQRDLIPEELNLISLGVIGTTLKNPDNIIVGHNISFDVIGWERFYKEQKSYKGIPSINAQLFCTMIANNLVAPEDEINSLAFISNKYLGLRKLDMKPKEIVSSNIEKLLLYNAIDSMLVYLLYYVLKEKLEEKGLLTLFNYLMKVLEILIRMSIKGVKLDIDYIKTHRAEVENKIEEIYNKLLESFGDINFNSWQQLGKVMYEDWGLPVLKLSATGNPSTDVDTIVKLRNSNISDKHKSSLANLSNYRQLKKLHGTYLKPLEENHLGFDGRIHTQYFLGKGFDLGFGNYGTTSGRTSSSHPNLQNQPNTVTIDGLTVNIRRAFIPGKGYKFFKADYSQLEMRVAAFLSKDSNMLDVFKRGIDIHTHSLTGVYEESYDYIVKKLEQESEDWKRRRLLIKNFNFALIYGASPFKLQMMLLKQLEVGMDIDEVRRIVKVWNKMYPRFTKWKYEIFNLIYELGFVRTETGRERFFFNEGEGHHYDKSTLAKFYREGLNDLIQSLASDICLFGLIYVYDTLVLETGYGHPLLLVHDSIDGEYNSVIMTDKELEQVFKWAMIDKPKEILRKEFDVDTTNLFLDIEVKPNLKHWS